MTLDEINARQAELDRFCDWLVSHYPYNYMNYYHERGAELDAMRPGDEA